MSIKFPAPRVTCAFPVYFECEASWRGWRGTSELPDFGFSGCRLNPKLTLSPAPPQFVRTPARLQSARVRRDAGSRGGPTPCCPRGGEGNQHPAAEVLFELRGCSPTQRQAGTPVG